MTTRDRLLALLVAVIWGLNFPATHVALDRFPPFLLVSVRFALIAVPTVLLVPRPDVPLRWLLGYGAGFGIAQFTFLYLAMANGMPSGLASLVLQSSAPFTVVLGGLLLRERVTGRQAVGIAVAMSGLVLIAVHRAQAAAIIPVLLTVAGGFGWALGNLANRQAHPSDPFRFTLWMSVVPPLPMLALSLAVEGPRRDWAALRGVTSTDALPALAGLAYIVVIATLCGSGIWSTLMARNPSSQVAPFSMAVPAAGMAASWALLHETVDSVEILGAIIVIGGVVHAARRPSRRACARHGVVSARITVPAPQTPRLRPGRKVLLDPSPSPHPRHRRAGCRHGCGLQQFHHAEDDRNEQPTRLDGVRLGRCTGYVHRPDVGAGPDRGHVGQRVSTS